MRKLFMLLLIIGIGSNVYCLNPGQQPDPKLTNLYNVPSNTYNYVIESKNQSPGKFTVAVLALCAYVGNSVILEYAKRSENAAAGEDAPPSLVEELRAAWRGVLTRQEGSYDIIKEKWAAGHGKWVVSTGVELGAPVALVGFVAVRSIGGWLWKMVRMSGLAVSLRGNPFKNWSRQEMTAYYNGDGKKLYGREKELFIAEMNNK